MVTDEVDTFKTHVTDSVEASGQAAKTDRKSVASREGQAVSMNETEKRNPPAEQSAPPPSAVMRPPRAWSAGATLPYPTFPSRPLPRSATSAAEAVGVLPNVVIIGAMKCGTTSLHEYLGYHPEIGMSERKETHFFVAEHNWSKGLSWYRQHFPERKKAVGESSPTYTRFPLYAGVPERMHMVVPSAKLLYCVRDPIKRMVSHYVHSFSLGRENRPFEEAMLARENNPYLLSSLYHYQLEQYLRFFDVGQLKVVVLEDLYKAPLPTLRDVFGFLGVDPTYEDSRFTRPSATMPAAATRRRNALKSFMVQRNVRGVYWLERNAPWVFGRPIEAPKVTPALRAELTAMLQDDVNALRALTGHRLAAWSL